MLIIYTYVLLWGLFRSIYCWMVCNADPASFGKAHLLPFIGNLKFLSISNIPEYTSFEYITYKKLQSQSNICNIAHWTLSPIKPYLFRWLECCAKFTVSNQINNGGAFRHSTRELLLPGPTFNIVEVSTIVIKIDLCLLQHQSLSN